MRAAAGPLSERALARALAARKGLDGEPATPAELRKTAQGVLRRLTAKGAAQAVASGDGPRAWERV